MNKLQIHRRKTTMFCKQNTKREAVMLPPTGILGTDSYEKEELELVFTQKAI